MGHWKPVIRSSNEMPATIKDFGFVPDASATDDFGFVPDAPVTADFGFVPDEAAQPAKPSQADLHAQFAKLRATPNPSTLSQLPAALFTPSDETRARAAEQVAAHALESV